MEQECTEDGGGGSEIMETDALEVKLTQLVDILDTKGVMF